MTDDEIKLQLKAERAAIKEANAKIGRPFLFNRMACGLLDFLLIIVLAVALFFAIFFIFNKETFDNDMNSLNTLMENSSLYIKDGDNLYQLKYNTDDSKTAHENFDEPLNNFYLKYYQSLNEFNSNKESSNLFVFVNNKYVLKDDAKEEDILSFYESEYDKAFEVFTNTSEFTFYTFRIGLNIGLDILISFFISSTILYLVVPLFSSEGETIFQRIFKICLIDSRDNSTVKKYQVLLRYLATVFVNIYLPLILLIFLNFGMYSFVPLIVSLFLMSLTKNNRALQDYMSFTDVVNKNRQSAFTSLKGKN